MIGHKISSGFEHLVDGTAFKGVGVAGPSLVNSLAVNKSQDAVPDITSLITQLSALVDLLRTVLMSNERVVKSKLTDVLTDNPVVNPAPDRAPIPVTQKISAISNKSAGKLPDDVWLGVSEGQGGNSGILAGIKAAMMRFGQSPLGVFSTISENQGTYEVVMRDGYKVLVTRDEVEKARQCADFRGTDSGMIKDATFIYAVAAKRMENEAFSGPKTGEHNNSRRDGPYQGAMDELNSTYWWASKTLPRLGLSDHMRKIPWSELEAKGGVGIVMVGAESLLMANGYTDMYGPVKLQPDAVNLNNPYALGAIELV